MEHNYKKAISLATLAAAIASPLAVSAASSSKAETSGDTPETKHAVTEIYGSFMTGGNEFQEKPFHSTTATTGWSVRAHTARTAC